MSTLVNGFNLSINCGLEPDTGKLRRFSSAFRSLTFISSSLPVIFAGIDVSEDVEGAGDG